MKETKIRRTQMLTNQEMTSFQSLIPFWDQLKPTEKELLQQETIIKKYMRGTTIYNGSSECVGILVVRSGRLRTYMLSNQGKDITLFRLYASDMCVLSATCLLRNITFDVQVDADLDSELYVINTGIFAKLMTENVYVENETYKAALDKFSDVMWTMEQILFMSFDQRLAIFLFDETQKANSNTLSITHSQIASYIGSAREVVSRMLKYFEEEGIVTLSRKDITILSRTKLKQLVQK